MDEENESELQDNYDNKKQSTGQGGTKIKKRNTGLKKNSFSYNDSDEIEDSDTEDIFEL